MCRAYATSSPPFSTRVAPSSTTLFKEIIFLSLFSFLLFTNKVKYNLIRRLIVFYLLTTLGSVTLVAAALLHSSSSGGGGASTNSHCFSESVHR